MNDSTNTSPNLQKPTPAFVGASWFVLLVGVISYLIGLWNANMELNEKGYYLVILLFGLFSVISLQKTIRDRDEGIAVTNIYYGVTWSCVIASISFLVIGLWNAQMLLSEKGFYGLAMVLSLFAVITVQKNVRDLAMFNKNNPSHAPLVLEDKSKNRLDKFTESTFKLGDEA